MRGGGAGGRRPAAERNFGKSGAYEPLATALCRIRHVVIADGTARSAGRRCGAEGPRSRILVVRIPPDGIDNPWGPMAGGKEAKRVAWSLAEHFSRLLVAPKPFKEDVEEKDNPRESYFAQSTRSRRTGRIYEWFFNALAGRETEKPKVIPPVFEILAAQPGEASRMQQRTGRDHVAELKEKWEREKWMEQGTSHDLCHALSETRIHRHYAWASHLANYNGGRYRSLPAELHAVMARRGRGGRRDRLRKGPVSSGVKVAALAEVALLICILSIYWFGKRHRFHSQWLDCRRLAEWIRSLPMLLPLSRTPVLAVDANTQKSSQESWVGLDVSCGSAGGGSAADQSHEYMGPGWPAVQIGALFGIRARLQEMAAEVCRSRRCSPAVPVLANL